MIVGVFGGLWAAHQSIQFSPCRCFPLPDLYNGPPLEPHIHSYWRRQLWRNPKRHRTSVRLRILVQKPIQRVLFIALSHHIQK